MSFILEGGFRIDPGAFALGSLCMVHEQAACGSLIFGGAFLAGHIADSH